MFWMKKMAAGMVLAALVAGGMFAGLSTQSGGVAQATVPLANEPQAPPDDPDAAAKRLDKRLADLLKQKELLDETLVDLQAEKAKLNEAKKAKAAALAAAELGNDIAVAFGSGKPPYTVREVVNGKVSEVHCSDLDILTTYLKRALNDPKGPRKVRVSADKDCPYDQIRHVFTACATAGYAKASFSHNEERYTIRVVPYTTVYRTQVKVMEAEPSFKPGEIDLKQYAPKKP